MTSILQPLQTVEKRNMSNYFNLPVNLPVMAVWNCFMRYKTLKQLQRARITARMSKTEGYDTISLPAQLKRGRMRISFSDYNLYSKYITDTSNYVFPFFFPSLQIHCSFIHIKKYYNSDLHSRTSGINNFFFPQLYLQALGKRSSANHHGIAFSA